MLPRVHEPDHVGVEREADQVGLPGLNLPLPQSLGLVLVPHLLQGAPVEQVHAGADRDQYGKDAEQGAEKGGKWCPEG